MIDLENKKTEKMEFEKKKKKGSSLGENNAENCSFEEKEKMEDIRCSKHSYSIDFDNKKREKLDWFVGGNIVENLYCSFEEKERMEDIHWSKHSYSIEKDEENSGKDRD